MIIDFRRHPPTPPFRTYFNPHRLAPLANRLGAREMAPSFLHGSMVMFWDEMDQAGIDLGVGSWAAIRPKPF